MEEILKAKKKGSAALNEASLGRVYQHVSDDQPFAILTSWRQGLSTAENKSNFKKLKSAIRSAGLGFFKLLGHWREEGEDEATAKPSLFVPGMTKQLANQLGKKYDQDAVIYSGPETKGQVALLWKGGRLEKIGKFHPGRIAQAYSSVRGKTFTFECFEYPPQSHIEALIARLRSLRG